MTVTIARMGRKPKNPSGPMAGDRHKPSWQVRLPIRYQVVFKAIAEQHKAEHGVEVDAAAFVRAALDEYLAKRGIKAEG